MTLGVDQMDADHPDKWWTEYLVEGIRVCFKLGFTGEPVNLQLSIRNMKSVDEHPQVKSEEISEGKLWEVGSLGKVASYHGGALQSL